MDERDVYQAVFGGPLWGELQCRFVFYADGTTQKAVCDLVDPERPRRDRAEILQALPLGQDGADLLAPILALRNQPGWAVAVEELLNALAGSVRRELDRRIEVAVPPGFTEALTVAIQSLDFFAADDTLEVHAPPDGSHLFYVNWVSRRMSPEWLPQDGPWDRDTLFRFEVNFASGLFIWLSAHVVPQFRGKRIGTRFHEAAEATSRAAGIRRFVVLGPLNPGYWRDVMGYTIDTAHFVGRPEIGTWPLEAYKER